MPEHSFSPASDRNSSGVILFLLQIFLYQFLMFSSAAGNANIFDAILRELKMLNASHDELHEGMRFMRREFDQLRSSCSARSHLSEAVWVDAPDAPNINSPLSCDRDKRWACPVCHETLKHKESFKGHIRKLLYSSSRPKCHFNPQDVEHQLLVHRFAGESFYGQSHAFSREFYAQVCFSCTKRDDDDLSHAHVSSWIAAAKSNEVLGNSMPFPTYDPGCCTTRRKHPRTESEASQSSQQSTFGSLSSSFSSSFSP